MGRFTLIKGGFEGKVGKIDGYKRKGKATYRTCPFYPQIHNTLQKKIQFNFSSYSRLCSNIAKIILNDCDCYATVGKLRNYLIKICKKMIANQQFPNNKFNSSFETLVDHKQPVFTYLPKTKTYTFEWEMIKSPFGYNFKATYFFIFTNYGEVTNYIKMQANTKTYQLGIGNKVNRLFYLSGFSIAENEKKIIFYNPYSM